MVVSHSTESDPILNYGNQTALNLWELNWEDFIQTPSWLTAEPANREERERMLKTVTKQGFINNYRGIQISSTGKRFLLENAKIWNIIDSGGKYCGQAAICSHWSLIN